MRKLQPGIPQKGGGRLEKPTHSDPRPHMSRAGEKDKHEILREEQNLMLQPINLMFSELHKKKTVPIVLDGQKIAEAVQSTTHDNHEA